MVIQCPNCNARIDARASDDGKAACCEYCGTPLPSPAPPNGGDPIGNMMGKIFEDKDGNGLSDMFQAMASGASAQNMRQVSIQQSARFEINGVVYNSLEEMPPDVRRIFESTQVMAAGLMGRANHTPVVLESAQNVIANTMRSARRTVILLVAVSILLVLGGLMVVLLQGR